jgi:hypothetical protein
MKKRNLVKFAAPAVVLAAGLTACDSPVGPGPGPDPVKSLTVNIDRATNSVDVTGDIGPFTLGVGVTTVTDADGLDIPLANLNLSDAALTDITVTSDNGSATFGAMAPLTVNPNQEGLKAKLNYVIYALSALYNAHTLGNGSVAEGDMYALLEEVNAANNNVNEFIDNEADAATFNDTYTFTDYSNVPEMLAGADSTYILPYMNEIMAWYDANPTDAAIFQENLLKVWWNKLDTVNDADLNTAVEAEIKTLYPDVNSVAMMRNLKSNRGNELVSNPIELALAEVRVARVRA